MRGAQLRAPTAAQLRSDSTISGLGLHGADALGGRTSEIALRRSLAEGHVEESIAKFEARVSSGGVGQPSEHPGDASRVPPPPSECVHGGLRAGSPE